MNLPKRVVVLVLCALAGAISVQAQFAIRAGVNLANERKVFDSEPADYQSATLNAFSIGVTYQLLSKYGIGGEAGVIFSQKGSNFSYTDDTEASIQGFSQSGYIEIPLNVKYLFRTGVIGIYATAGLYGACAVYGKTTLEAESDLSEAIHYKHFSNRFDAGYNAGAGIELFKHIQLGVNWSQSFIGQEITENLIRETPVTHTNFNRVLAINLGYFF